MKLSIIVLGFNKVNFSNKCITQLCQLPNDHQILFFDNGSSDETNKELSELTLHPNYQYIRSETNLGFAGGNNKAYAQAKGDNILFINNDIRVNDKFNDWTLPLIEACKDDVLVGPTMGLLNSKFDFVKEANEYIDSKYAYMSGWCLASTKKTFDKLIVNDHDGPWSEEFGKGFFEDSDLSIRARQMGMSFKVVQVPITHFGHTTTNSIGTSKLYNYAKPIFIKKWQGKI